MPIADNPVPFVWRGSAAGAKSGAEILMCVASFVLFAVDLPAARIQAAFDWVAPAPPITAAAFSLDGRTVVVGSQSGVEIRDWPELTPRRRLDTALDHVHDLAFSPRGDRLAVAGGSPGAEGGVEVWSWPAAELVWAAAPHRDVVYAVAWSPDGDELATAGGDNVCRTFDGSGELRKTLFGHSKPVLSLQYLSQIEGVLISAGLDENLRVWDARDGRSIRTLHNHVAAVQQLAVRPSDDGPATIASASIDRTVRIWQPLLGPGRLVRFVRIPSPALQVAWQRDGRRLLVGAADGRVRVIDAETADVLREIPVLTGWVHTLAVAPNGDLLVGGANGQLCRLPAPVDGM